MCVCVCVCGVTRSQSRVYQTALFAPDNMLVCAPTGAGKTNVAMLTVMHEVGLHRQVHARTSPRPIYRPGCLSPSPETRPFKPL